MEHTRIRGIDLAPSRIGLGTWAIGGWMWGGSDEADAIRTIQSAVERGIHLIDTAPVYGFGRSEELVGRALSEAGRRHEVVIATKTGLDWSEGRPFRNATRKRIFAEVEESLRRLRTDVIDVYQVHWPDSETPIEETAGAMRTLLDQGKIRAIGVSNFSPDEMREFEAVAPIHAVQPPYNLFERSIEHDVLPYSHREGIAALVYGPLCRGLLSGKMTARSTFQSDDIRASDPKFRAPHYPRYLEAVKRLDDFARDNYGKRVIHLALRWVLDQAGVSAALWGARHPSQLDPVDEVMGWSLDGDALRAIDAIITETVRYPIGPEFMAPPPRSRLAA